MAPTPTRHPPTRTRDTARRPRGTRARPGVLVLLALATLAGGTGAWAEEAPGKLVYVRGTTSAQQANGALRILGSDAPVAIGEMVMTGAESFAILELADGTRVVMRPDTRVMVQANEPAPAAAAEAGGTGFLDRAAQFVLRLVGGGVRARTGSDADGEPRALRIDAPNGSVEGQGVELVARVCTDDCAAERASVTPVATPAVAALTAAAAGTSEGATVARALIVRGRVERVGTDGSRQRIRSGATLREGDVVATARFAHTVLAFTDGTRATVQPDSRLAVEAYRLAPSAVDDERIRLRVQDGGARIATGGISQRRFSNARFATPVATIGVRGTGFDLVEAAECGGEPAPTERPGLTASVWAGTIEFEETKTLVPAGKTVCVLEPGQVPKPVKDAPRLDTPRPDEVDVPGDTFTASEQSGGEPGLHVSVLAGEARLSSGARTVLLGGGEDGFDGGAGAVRAVSAQSPGRSDPFLKLDLGNPDSWDGFEPEFGVMCPAT